MSSCTETTRIIIAGGRDFCNPEKDPNWIVNEQRAFRQLSALLWGYKTSPHPRSYEGLEIVCGGALGADTVGKRWAEGNGVPVKFFIPQWKRPDGTTNMAAGHERNRDMGDYSDRLIDFWDGVSPGSKGMIDYGKRIGLIVRVINYD